MKHTDRNQPAAQRPKKVIKPNSPAGVVLPKPNRNITIIKGL